MLGSVSSVLFIGNVTETNKYMYKSINKQKDNIIIKAVRFERKKMFRSLWLENAINRHTKFYAE